MTEEEYRRYRDRRLAAEILELAASHDTEGAHSRADALLWEALIVNGYEDAVAAFRALKKWYA